MCYGSTAFTSNICAVSGRPFFFKGCLTPQYFKITFSHTQKVKSATCLFHPWQLISYQISGLSIILPTRLPYNTHFYLSRWLFSVLSEWKNTFRSFHKASISGRNLALHLFGTQEATAGMLQEGMASLKHGAPFEDDLKPSPAGVLQSLQILEM